ncbi:MAG: TraI/MobA(P) family conjugative relaxase [Myxococcales bacterium]
MIVKKISTSKTAAPKSKAQNVRALVDYIAGESAGGSSEKIEDRGAFNLLNVDHEGQVEEMVDLAEAGKRSPQPVQHWIMSWRQGEQPTPAQAREAVGMFLDEMGLSRHQTVYGMHRDTDHWHLHLAVNRVDPETEKVVTVNGRFDIEIAHRAIARIEHVQGWQREANGLYLQKADELERVRPRERTELQPTTLARDIEERTGERSAQRIAIEKAGPAMRKAGTWQELHQALAAEGLRFEKKGSGAILWVGDQPVKASTVDRACSMIALQKRLGDFQPAQDLALPAPESARAVADRLPEPLQPAAPGWHQYNAARAKYHQDRRERAAHLAKGGRDHWGTLAARHRRERADVLRGSWKGRGDLLNAARSVLAARQAQEKLEMRDSLQREREAGREKLGRFPNYAEWLRSTSPELSAEWRHRERIPASIEGPTFVPPLPQDIRAFKAVIDGSRVLYVHAGQPKTAAAFADRGKNIDIFAAGDRAAVLAALQLSAQKWGTFVVTGSDRFKKLCAELAAEHGLKIVNPELQEAIEAARSRRQVERDSRDHRPVEREAARDLPEVYRRHLEFAVRQPVGGRAPGGPDPSRIDAQVAVQMRMTGHPQSAVEKAIKSAAEARRPGEQRDWSEYSKRAAGYAWSVPGALAAQQLEPTRQQLLAIDGRQRERDALRGLGGPLGRG